MTHISMFVLSFVFSLTISFCAAKITHDDKPAMKKLASLNGNIENYIGQSVIKITTPTDEDDDENSADGPHGVDKSAFLNRNMEKYLSEPVVVDMATTNDEDAYFVRNAPVGRSGRKKFDFLNPYVQKYIGKLYEEMADTDLENINDYYLPSWDNGRRFGGEIKKRPSSQIEYRLKHTMTRQN